MGPAALLCVLALGLAPRAAQADPRPQGYGAGTARPQKVWTTTPFPDEVSPAFNDVYPQPQPQPQPQRPQPPPPQVAGQPASAPTGGSYWWASGNRPFSPQATGPVAQPQQPPPAVSAGNPFLSRPQQPRPQQPRPQQPQGGGGGGYGAGPSGPPQTPDYDIPCSQPGQVCVGIGQCQGGYVAPGANGIRQGQCSSASQTCCLQQQPQQPQQPPYSGGYAQPQPQPPPQIPRPQPQPTYQGGYNAPQPNYYQPQPQPTSRPYTGPLNTTPYPGCAAALKCVEEIYCTAEGVMSDSPQYLTREQQENRVPMTECQNPETGIIGKCCRDPNYKDPWPGGMMMKNMPTGPGASAPAAPPPPPPPQRPPPPQNYGQQAPQQQRPFQDTCANSGGVCVPSQQCPSTSRMQPEQECVTLTSGQPGKCCSYAVNAVSGGGGDGYGK